MANSMNDPQGVELPGVASSGGLSWQEVDVSQGLETDMSQLPDNFVGDVSQVVGMTADHDSMFNSDGSSGFQDQLSPSLGGGMQSMQGIVGGTSPASEPQLMDGKMQENVGFNLGSQFPTYADVSDSLPEELGEQS